MVVGHDIQPICQLDDISSIKPSLATDPNGLQNSPRRKHLNRCLSVFLGTDQILGAGPCGRQKAALYSTALWLEYEAVLTRPVQLTAMRLSSAEVGNVLAALAVVAEPVPIHFLWRPVLADAEDEHVLDLAMNVRADMLVTFNQDDFVEASKTFQIEVVTPAVALRRLRE